MVLSAVSVLGGHVGDVVVFVVVAFGSIGEMSVGGGMTDAVMVAIVITRVVGVTWRGR